MYNWNIIINKQLLNRSIIFIEISYNLYLMDNWTIIHQNIHEGINENICSLQTLIIAENLSRWSFYYYMGFCYACCVSFESVPVIHNLQKIESYDNITFRLEIVVHMWLPFDYEFDFTNWVIIQVIMVYIGFLAITYILFFDTVNMLVIYHVIGHITIFKQRIKAKFSDKNDMTQEEIHKNLVEISRYYTFIKK